MRQVLTALFALSTALALGGCAGNRSSQASAVGSNALASGDADERAVLVGCSSYNKPPVSRHQVALSYLVDVHGKVEPSSIRVELEQGTRGPDQPSFAAVTAAKRAALSCSYEPARRDGRAIQTRVHERFSF